jgi:uncharacterized protein YbbC (DUF1343 family)
MKRSFLFLEIFLLFLTCSFGKNTTRIITGDERTEQYLPLLKGQKVALFSNRTGMADKKHILDVLTEHQVDVTCIFSPEHGFRGLADAGEHVQSSVDQKTGVPILSLYGGNSPLKDPQTMERFDVLVVDIQDVGLRFYTYYITMCHLMDACAASNKSVIILDRPNPNGHYVDGPVLDMTLRSGVGWLPIPVVHGMTLGELAQMINGEGWLEEHRKCRLTVIPCLNYTHATKVDITLPPSPNLPNLQAVLLYPSLCYFEATPVSVGRGTRKPFQIFGHPAMKGFPYTFTPKSRPGATNPPQKGKRCYGRDLSHLSEKIIRERGIDLSYLIEAYRSVNIGDDFFTNFFEKLIGNKNIRSMIEHGKSAAEIRATWQNEVEKFKQQRRPYLLYPE